MADLFLLFNHTITSLQEERARTELGVKRIVEPPENIRKLWAAIPPESGSVASQLEPVITWLDQEAVPGDYILIHGDFGACYFMVCHTLSKGYVPVYSTTDRIAVEKQLDDDSIQLVHRFNHVRFRKYKN